MRKQTREFGRRAPLEGQLAAFRRDEGGNMIMLLAMMLIPLAALAGFAIDFGRAQLVRTGIQAAADAAVTASALKLGATEAEIEVDARRFFLANAGDTGSIRDLNFTVSKNDDGIRVTVEGKIPTTLLSVINYQEVAFSVVSEAKVGAGDMEVALVLDNTGSMRDYMNDLKQGARDLADSLFDATSSAGALKMAVVPYVGAVNIGTAGGQMAWMDVNGDSTWHGRMFEWHWIAKVTGCAWVSPPPDDDDSDDDDDGPGAGGGGDDRSAIEADRPSRFATLFHTLLGIGTAHASSPTPPAGHSLGGYEDADGNPCFLIAPEKVNHFDLFATIPGTTWKGCVEARPEPFDVDDTPPDAGDPNTLFVPYLWPDEGDAGQAADPYPNDFMLDGPPPAGFDWDWDHNRVFNIWKYDGRAAAIDETPPATKGPNQACPDPITPLTTTRGQILSAINQMDYWEGSGTVASEGIAWGWRVLSPTAPFTEGSPYGETTKVIVLMTDGKNWASEQPSGATYTDYTAYSYLQYGRVSPVTYMGYKDFINSRMLEACGNAKAAGVIIYTITFGNLDEETRNLYEACATEPPYHYSATTAGELVRAFRNIGGELSALRISR